MIDFPSYLGVGAALWAAYIAQRGLNTWRDQLSGGAEYELARRTLRRLYELRDAIAWTRNSFISKGEIQAARTKAGLPPEEVSERSTLRDEGYVYDLRWPKVLTARRELGVELLECEVLWGAQLEDLAKRLDKLISTLYIAVLHRVRARDDTGPRTEASRLRDEKMKATLWADASDPDTYGSDLASLLEQFEIVLRPHLSRSRLKGIKVNLSTPKR